MAQEAMVTETLSQEMIDAGRQLTGRLDHRLLISAALWLYLDEPDRWRLIIASPKVKETGPRKVYQLIQSVLRSTQVPFEVISLSDISAVEPDSPLVSPFRGLIKVSSPPIGVRVSRSTFNGHFVEGAYIYKLP